MANAIEFRCWASSTCGVSVEHMNDRKPMVRSLYQFHVYYHIRKILEIPLPYENSFHITLKIYKNLW